MLCCVTYVHVACSNAKIAELFARASYVLYMNEDIDPAQVIETLKIVHGSSNCIIRMTCFVPVFASYTVFFRCERDQNSYIVGSEGKKFK